MYLKKRVVIIVLAIVAIVIFALCFYIGYFQKEISILKDFKIISMEEKNGDIYYSFEKNLYATKYEIVITSNDEEEIIREVTSNKGKITDLDYQYLDVLSIKVLAYNKNNDQKKSSNTIDLTWLIPSFSKDNNAYITHDHNVLVEGDFVKNNYRFVLKYGSETIMEEEIVEKFVVIPYDKVHNYSGRLTAYILNDKDEEISKYNFFVNTVQIGNVEIISPVTEIISWDDFVFSYEGGQNADRYELYIYENNRLKDIKEIKEKETVLKIKNFKENTKYTLKLVASYKDYEELSRSDSITFETAKKKVVSQVYTEVDFASLRPGTELTLKTKTEEAKILYSLDGSDPLKGSLYTEPIKIEHDTTVKAIAIATNMNNSMVSTFDVVVKDKVPVIYLSPSNQKSNKGVSKVGYTNEREMMNKVADVVERKLKENGVIVYRNNPEDNMMTWLSESRNVKSDLHVAIHSNGSANHNVQGMEIYVHEESSAAYSVAQVMYDDLYSIYPYQSAKTNRGVMFARGRMGEVHPLNIRFGLLIEMAYHDYEDDAKWIVDNIDAIGESIANSILKYFQVS